MKDGTVKILQLLAHNYLATFVGWCAESAVTAMSYTGFMACVASTGNYSWTG